MHPEVVPLHGKAEKSKHAVAVNFEDLFFFLPFLFFGSTFISGSSGRTLSANDDVDGSKSAVLGGTMCSSLLMHASPSGPDVEHFYREEKKNWDRKENDESKNSKNWRITTIIIMTSSMSKSRSTSAGKTLKRKRWQKSAYWQTENMAFILVDGLFCDCFTPKDAANDILSCLPLRTSSTFHAMENSSQGNCVMLRQIYAPLLLFFSSFERRRCQYLWFPRNRAKPFLPVVTKFYLLYLMLYYPFLFEISAWI